MVEKTTEATGYYHKYNFLKFRILETLAWSTKPLTANDISDKTGINTNKIKSAITNYLKKGIPYIQRLKKKACGKTNKAYRYKITKSGMKAYIEYLTRIERGIDLNRLRPWKVKRMETYGRFSVRNQRKNPEDFKLKPEQLFPYLNVRCYGAEILGLKKEDLLVVSGIIKT